MISAVDPFLMLLAFLGCMAFVAHALITALDEYTCES
jgi:hypothetical protein